MRQLQHWSKKAKPDNYMAGLKPTGVARSALQLIFTSKAWSITWNNPPYTDDDAYCLSERMTDPIFKRAVWQLEEGRLKGTRHLQIYVELYEEKNVDWFLSHRMWGKGIYYSPIKKGEEKKVEGYVKKRKTRVVGPYTFNK